MPRLPTITLVLGSYLAGLLLGFGGRLWAAVLIASSLAAWSLISGAMRPLFYGVFALAGALIARGESAGARPCAMATALTIDRVTIDRDAAPGAFVRGRARDCSATFSMFVREGSATAGSVVRVDGDRSPSSDGVVIRNARLSEIAQAPLLNRIRARAGRSIDLAFRGDAPLARALLVADTKALSPELRERFAVSGMAHILSISGMHVAIIALAVELVFGAMRIPARYAYMLSLGVIVIYVAVLGAPPPAVRSAAMLAVRAVSRMAQRPTSTWAILALGAMHPVISPQVVRDLGYQLSVVGVGALIAGGALVKRLPLAKRPRWRREVMAGIIISTVATVASAPLVLWSFGRVSAIGPVANLAAGPVVAVLQPMLFLALVLAPIPAAASFVADAAHPLLLALDGIARITASVPGAAVNSWATPLVAVLIAIASGATLIACLHERPIRPAVIAAFAFVGVVWAPILPNGSGLAELHMIDVGQGDAIALRTPRGHWLVFDAGRSWRGGDAGRSTVVPYIAKRGGSVDMFVLSHPHNDHVGGAASLIDALRPDAYYDAAFAEPNASYLASLNAARSGHLRWARAHPGDSVVVDGVAVLFLAPDSAWTASLSDPNNASVATLVRIGDVRMLLVGDAESDEEAWLVERWGERLAADVLKVGHHGSSTSSTPRFLDLVKPRLALISVGAGNTYGHPSPSVLADLAARNAHVLRTDLMGTLIVRTDGRRLLVEAGGTRWELPSRRRGNPFSVH